MLKKHPCVDQWKKFNITHVHASYKKTYSKNWVVCVCGGGGGEGGKGGKREEGLDRKTEGEVGLEVLTSDYFQMS